MRHITLLVAVLSLLLLLGCDGPTGPAPSEFCSDHPDAAIATFEDANLEGAIRVELSVTAQQDLTCGLISGLTELNASFDGITSLVGIQNLTSLEFLDLDDNSITDISALSGLTSLTSLELSTNFINDISPLSGLTSLTPLGLSLNPISTISPLSGLTSLTTLTSDFQLREKTQTPRASATTAEPAM